MTAITPSAPGRQIRTEQQRRDFEAEIKAKVALSEKYKAVWQGLNDFIHRRGGFLISPPGEKDLRLEVPQFSELPDELESLGYHLAPAGTDTKIIGGRFVPMRLFTFRIPTPR